MIFSNKMTLILVVWQLASLVRSEHDISATPERSRRAQLKIRMLERLAERGLEAAERELAAEELLARLDAHTTTEFPHFRFHRYPIPQPLERRSSLSPQLEEAAMRLALDPTEAEVPPPFVPVFPSDDEEADEAKVEAAEEARDLERVRLYLQGEVAHGRQELASAGLLKAMPDATRQRRFQRSHRREGRKKKRDSKKKKREDKKKRNRKRDREYKRLMEREDVLITTEDGEQFYDCCPSKVVVKEIKVGKARDNYAMDISASHQLFYERVCLEGYEGKECVFPPRTLRRDVTTRCHQQYSYTQAIARPYESDGEYMQDYIKIRSGCSCQISVTQKKKKRKRKR
ncbi:uncharacterized protein LOC134786195 [Penaeus indicus]|uniref:uncharacterized protein LOC134786195 n=1 Tax=Penaeus indicus TaxID=29960 RepID=UPI00300D97DB